MAYRNRKPVGLLTAVILLVIFAPIAYFVSKNASPSEAAWFDDTFAYRQTVPITNAGSAQTDFQVAITLNTSALVTAGKMQADCDDIRITDISGKPLPYWVETGTNACNTTTTAIWTKVPSIPTSGTTVYLYYGNPSATSTQNGNGIFEFFDDFSNGSSKWTVDSGSWSVVNGEYVGSGTGFFSKAVNFTFTNGIIETRQKTVSGNYYHGLFFRYTDSSNFYGMTVTGVGDRDYLLKKVSGSLTESSFTAVYTADNAFHKIKAVINGTSLGFYKDGSLVTMQNGTNPQTDASFSSGKIALGGIQLAGQTNTDWVFVRKYAATEPTTASPINEEKSPAPVAYWKFDEGYDTNTQDSTQNNNDGSITTATWQSEDLCISGKCLKFDGNTSYVDVGNSNNYKFGTGDFTVEFWMKANEWDGSPDAHEYMMLMGNGNYVANWDGFQFGRVGSWWATHLGVPQGSIMMMLGNGTNNEAVSSNQVLSPNTWYHITGVRQGGTAYFYLNGIRKSNASIGYDVTVNRSLFIGKQNDATYSRPFNGFIDDVKIYSYARTAAQIKSDYASKGSSSTKGTSVQMGSSNKNLDALSNGLVGYWKMDESATPSLDSSGNSNSGTWSGNTAATIGKFGNGTVFDGAGDRIEAIDSPSLDITNAITLSVWIKLNYSMQAIDIIADKKGEIYTLQGSQGGDGTKIQFSLIGPSGPDNSLDSTTQFTTQGVWYHVVGTYDGSTQKIYVNGILENSVARTGAITTNNNNFLIGGYDAGSGYDFNGSIDEVRLYNRALSDAEVSQLYNWTPGPIANYNFEEGQGTSVNDASGNTNTGNWNGTAPYWTQGKYGKGGKFNGSDNYVSCGTNLGLSGNFSGTIEAWVKRNGDTEETVFVAGSAVSLQSFGITVNIPSAGAFSSSFNGGMNRSSSAGLIPINTWTHLAVTKTPGAIESTTKLYLNGVEVSNTGSTGTPNFVANLCYVGTWTNQALNFGGSIDDVRIYNYARTAKQIVSDMNAGHPNVGSPVGSPVGYWKFDEGADNTCSGGTNDACNSGSGGSALDGAESGMSVPATATSGWTQAGKFGKALSFDGLNDYVNIPDNVSYNFGTGDFAISYWIKFNTTAGYQVPVDGGYSSNKGVLIETDNTTAAKKVRIYLGTFLSGTWAWDFSAGTWYNFVVTRTGTSLYIYIDGVQLGVPSTNSTSVGNYSYLIGKYSGGEWVNGQIDELKIYNYALTADEVKLDMNRGSSQVLGAVGDNSSYAINAANQEYCIPGDATSCAAPVGRWNFEEGTGGNANDTSGNGQIGTSSNNTVVTGIFGKGRNFTGASNSYIQATITNLPLNATPRTMNAWFKTSDTTARHRSIAAYGTAAAGKPIYMLDVNATHKLYTESGSGADAISSTASVNDGKWHFGSLAYDGTTLKLYLDGVLQGSSNCTLATQTSNFGIGEMIWSTNLNFIGDVDNVQLYDYARTPAQIAYDYNKGAPVGLWKLDECQGTVANDSSGNGNSGTITIGATGTNTSAGTCTGSAGEAWKNGAIGKYNSSLEFDGTDDWIDLGTSTKLDIAGNNQYTLSAWIYRTSSGTQYVIDKQQAGLKGYYIYVNASEFCAGVPNGSSWNESCSSGASLALSSWTHILVTYDGSYQKFYKNGVLLNSPAQSAILLNSTSNLNIARYNGAGYYFPGKIDDVRIYNYALTPTQVKTLYNNGAINFGPATGVPQ